MLFFLKRAETPVLRGRKKSDNCELSIGTYVCSYMCGRGKCPPNTPLQTRLVCCGDLLSTNMAVCRSIVLHVILAPVDLLMSLIFLACLASSGNVAMTFVAYTALGVIGGGVIERVGGVIERVIEWEGS